MRNSLMAIIVLSIITLLSPKAFTNELKLHKKMIGTAIAGIRHHGLPFPPPVILPPPFVPSQEFTDSTRKRHRHHVRHAPNCRRIKTIVHRGGHPQTITRRICGNDRDGFHNRHHHRDHNNHHYNQHRRRDRDHYHRYHDGGDRNRNGHYRR